MFPISITFADLAVASAISMIAGIVVGRFRERHAGRSPECRVN